MFLTFGDTSEYAEFKRSYARNLAKELAAKRAQAAQAVSVQRASARKMLVIQARHPLALIHPRVPHQAPAAVSSRSSGGGDDGPEGGPADPVAALLSTFAQEVR